MNNEYKKGFLEAIDGVLEIIVYSGVELEKENKTFKYELNKLENSVLGLKVAFFETYYENLDESDEILEKEDDEYGPLIISKENILKYCEKNGLTLEEYTERLKYLLKEFPPKL